ncbi:plastocyanin/azurin family copper-binding protein [Halorarum salinum]|uniref:Copper-binding protein n=1 Tax=Halorarum salinum TaxID=2743089 RepID=A0A7D5QA26_9EURY|nr:plastocyanin/azurin family copper-binding protein [Halobaculum salinum]QLG62276.1 copper-binding protein [Halobaculum salinum]
MPSGSCDRRSFVRLGGAALSAVPTVGCLRRRPTAARRVTMTDAFAFDPRTATVGAGRTVRWENESDVGHTVTAYGDAVPSDARYFASGGFDSERAARAGVTEGLVPPGGEYEHAFEEPGTYGYFCIPHESSGMVGTVRVE